MSLGPHPIKSPRKQVEQDYGVIIIDSFKWNGPEVSVNIISFSEEGIHHSCLRGHLENDREESAVSD